MTVAIPLADAPALRRFRNRTRLLRVLLAAALLATAAAAFLSAGASGGNGAPLLPPGSSGVIVLDMSASAEAGTLDKLYGALTQLARSGDRFGLVVFSSRAYEALPPGTPASALLPFVRFFRPLPPSGPGQFPGTAPFNPGITYPTNPWAFAFSFGTAISSGLDLARELVLQSGMRRPAVWLLSDLADASQDRALVARSARTYIDSGVALHVIGLGASRSDTRFFERLLGPRGTFVPAKPSTTVKLHPTHPFPLGLAVSAALLAALLALNELLSTTLRWGASPAAAGGSA